MCLNHPDVTPDDTVSTGKLANSSMTHKYYRFSPWYHQTNALPKGHLVPLPRARKLFRRQDAQGGTR